MGFGTGGGEGSDGGIAAGESEDLVPVFEEFLDGGLADEAGGSGDEDTHVWFVMREGGLMGWGLEEGMLFISKDWRLDWPRGWFSDD